VDVHASPAELPKLNEFLGAFRLRFRRPEGAAALEHYMTELLTELPHKTCDTIAQMVPSTREQRLQEFLTNRQGDRVGSCQIAVTCCYSDPQVTWPVAVRGWRVTTESLQQVGKRPGERATRSYANLTRYLVSLVSKDIVL
jgi:hypothetical protein